MNPSHPLLLKLPRPMADLFRASGDNAVFLGIEDAVALGEITEGEAVEVLRRIALRVFVARPVPAAPAILEVSRG